MATIELALNAEGKTYINESNTSDGSVLNLRVLGSHELIVEGVEVDIYSLLGGQVAQELTLVAGQGGTINLNQGLLNASLLSSLNFSVEGKGEINFDASALQLLNGALTSYTVNFSGGHTGAFNYKPPNLALLSTTTFVVNDMQAGDQFNIMGSTRTWVPRDTSGRIGLQGTYDPNSGYLQFRSDYTVVNVKMTQAQATLVMNDFSNNGGLYWKPYLEGSTRVGYSFIFPGSYLCYGDGALVQTVAGYRPVESLRAGDMLVCADGRLRALLWKGQSRISAQTLDLRPDLRPIRIAAGALAPGYPFEDLTVSPQHRIWVDGPAIRAATGGSGGLIAAKHLLGLPGITLAPAEEGVRYHHLLMSSHEIIRVNGILSETLHLGEWALRTLDSSARQAVEALRPMLGSVGESRHPLLTGKVARQVTRLYGRRREMFFEHPGQFRPPLAAQVPAQALH